jgi:hypothetical protein
MTKKRQNKGENERENDRRFIMYNDKNIVYFD